MSYIGGGPYYAQTCPECGAVMWNGRCENPDCNYHWSPMQDDDDGNDGTEQGRQVFVPEIMCNKNMHKEENSMLNRTVMMGRLCIDPELRQTQNNVSVCSLRIAVSRDYGDKNGEKKTDFFDVVAWRGTAEFICKYFSKGRMIVVDGRMQTRPWTDREGNERVAIELVADNAYFGDSKRSDGDQATDDYPGQVPGAFGENGGYTGPMPGSVPGDYAPDF